MNFLQDSAVESWSSSHWSYMSCSPLTFKFFSEKEMLFIARTETFDDD